MKYSDWQNHNTLPVSDGVYEVRLKRGRLIHKWVFFHQKWHQLISQYYNKATKTTSYLFYKEPIFDGVEFFWRGRID